MELNRLVASTKAAIGVGIVERGHHARPAPDHHFAVSTTAAWSRLEMVKCSSGRPTEMNGSRLRVGLNVIESGTSP